MKISNWELDELGVLVGLEEVVHEVCVEGRLDQACDEGGPNYVLPFKYPESGGKVPVEDVESSIEAQEQDVVGRDVLDIA